MPLWSSIPFLAKLFLVSFFIGGINYIVLRRKGYTSITYFILGIGATFTLLYQISKMI